MSKKTFCILGVMLVLLTSTTAQAYSNNDNVCYSTADCSHSRTIYKETGYIDYYNASSEEHGVGYEFLMYCADCYKSLGRIVHYEYEPHNCSSQTDLGHSGIKHVWEFTCKCGYSYTRSYVCGGPPCQVPFSLQKDE